MCAAPHTPPGLADTYARALWLAAGEAHPAQQPESPGVAADMRAAESAAHAQPVLVFKVKLRCKRKDGVSQCTHGQHERQQRALQAATSHTVPGLRSPWVPRRLIWVQIQQHRGHRAQAPLHQAQQWLVRLAVLRTRPLPRHSHLCPPHAPGPIHDHHALAGALRQVLGNLLLHHIGGEEDKPLRLHWLLLRGLHWRLRGVS